MSEATTTDLDALDEPPPIDHKAPWVPVDTFGARLALVRQRMGWNVAQAARMCGLSGATWATWENGAMPQRMERVCSKIAGTTGCDLDWLLRGGPIEPQKFSLSMRPDLRLVPQIIEPEQGALFTMP